MRNHLLTFHTLSPLHCGVGQAMGAIELPIAREKATHIPVIPGSSIKGVLRAESTDKDLQKAAFGPDTQGADEHAGGIQFSDARLVLLPMRSLKGVFAWTTSPYLLERLGRDLVQLRQTGFLVPTVEQGSCHVTSTSILRHQDKVFLDDLDFGATQGAPGIDDLATRLGKLFFPETPEVVARRLCIVSDDVMSLLMEMGTELQTRVCLDPDTKTVKKGQLWQEENLPVESLLVGLVQVNAANGKAATTLAAHLKALCTCNGRRATLQFGGKSTVGKGLCQVGLVEGGN